ncbi:MAG: Cysteine desulfurase [Thermotoga sp. 50_1627]|uniref:cysteine desulfurase family protein n=1 Tax=Pseudothermotoga sp. TaxID=2033661 RepID=UPI00076D3B00|nr:MAG: Cysteine desulfurase [Thermotoga sp. 50_64]KUK24396.1 MAG: Cysteine desulfurase [Thermotoga sp. 50_1627]MBC7116426.1 cysteine desulfurase [Pseudothermotoga sp.]MDK2923507.1 cysteine desulfurase [Pseudothermotoga sp.]HBT39787.1 cysteine desulfurase [Pseudothermotoga sp.]
MRVYLDHAATTRVFDEVAQETVKFFTQFYGNSSSLHSHGYEAKRLYEEARSKIAKHLNVETEEIYFTSGGTESDNIAIRGFLKANHPEGGHIITTQIEHPAVLELTRQLEKEGYSVTYLEPTTGGYVTPEDFRKAIRRDTVLASIMWVNNETGVIQPIEEISRIAREHGIVLHSDAVQAIGKIKIDARLVDMLSASGHKFYAPKGCGFLYVSKRVKVEPIMYGGGHERGLRSGTENVPGACAMALALEIIEKNYEVWSEKVKRFKEKILRAIEDIPDHHVNGSNTIFSHISVSFKNVLGETLATALDMNGISVSTASACSSHHGTRRSHVLEAMQLEDWMIDGAIRISLGYDNSEDEIEYFVNVLSREVNRLRRMS